MRAGGRIPRPDGRPSAVLVALYEERHELVVVLTKRAHGLRANPGEIAFPGGRQDPGETPVQTALREAFEETALDPALPVVIGELDHLTTRASRSAIVPVVARLPHRPDLVPFAAEVAAVYHVPVAELLSDGVYREERWGVGEDEPADLVLRARGRDRLGCHRGHVAPAPGGLPGPGGRARGARGLTTRRGRAQCESGSKDHARGGAR